MFPTNSQVCFLQVVFGGFFQVNNCNTYHHMVNRYFFYILLFPVCFCFLGWFLLVLVCLLYFVIMLLFISYLLSTVSCLFGGSYVVIFRCSCLFLGCRWPQKASKRPEVSILLLESCHFSFCHHFFDIAIYLFWLLHFHILPLFSLTKPVGNDNDVPWTPRRAPWSRRQVRSLRDARSFAVAAQPLAPENGSFFAGLTWCRNGFRWSNWTGRRQSDWIETRKAIKKSRKQLWSINWNTSVQKFGQKINTYGTT